MRCKTLWKGTGQDQKKVSDRSPARRPGLSEASLRRIFLGMKVVQRGIDHHSGQYPARVGMIGDQRVHVCRHRDSLVQRVAGRKATRQVGNRRMPQSLCRAQSRSGSASCPPIAQPFCGSQRPVPRFFERSESRMSFERRFRDVRRRSARRLEDDAAGARHYIIFSARSAHRGPFAPGTTGSATPLLHSALFLVA
jgi:hypothetical protein